MMTMCGGAHWHGVHTGKDNVDDEEDDCTPMKVYSSTKVVVYRRREEDNGRCNTPTTRTTRLRAMGEDASDEDEEYRRGSTHWR